MTLLQIYIPEQFSSSAQPACPWALHEASGRLLRSGESAFSDMPQADTVQVIVPAARVLLTEVRMPTKSRQKLARLLPYAVEEKLMYDPDTTHVAAGQGGVGDATPVAVVERRWLETVLGALQSAGLRPCAMLAETLLPRQTAGTWTVVWNGSGGFVKTGEMSGQGVDGGSQDMPPLGLILAFQEAQAASRAPRAITLCLAPGSEAPDVALWTQHLGVPVALGETWIWAAAAKQAEAGINLLQGEFAPASSFTGIPLARLKPALILAGLIALLQFGGGAVDWLLLRHQASNLRSDMEASFRKAFPEAKVVVDPALQMRRNLADLRHAAGQPDSSDMLPLLAKAAPALGAVKVITLQYERGTLKLEVRLQGTSASDLNRRLSAAGLSAELDNPAAQVGATVRLVLTEARG